MKLPWPEIPSSHRPDDTIREILDYLVWIAEAMSEVGLHGGPEAGQWRARIQTAYRVLFLPPVPGHGDPYPPDVPPPLHPGAWPDIPAESLPGMTVRHQLKVIELLALSLRDTVWVHGREPEIVEWDRRLSLARDALDQPDPVPEDARSAPSDAALAEAKAQEEAKLAHARRRERRLRRLKDQARRKKASAPAKKTPARKAAPKKAAAKKKAAPKKKAAKKAVGKKPPRTKTATRKSAARKAGPKKKAAPRKPGAQGRGSGKKATPKKKASTKKQASTRKKRSTRKKA